MINKLRRLYIRWNHSAFSDTMVQGFFVSLMIMFSLFFPLQVFLISFTSLSLSGYLWYIFQWLWFGMWFILWQRERNNEESGARHDYWRKRALKDAGLE